MTFMLLQVDGYVIATHHWAGTDLLICPVRTRHFLGKPSSNQRLNAGLKTAITGRLASNPGEAEASDGRMRLENRTPPVLAEQQSLST